MDPGIHELETSAPPPKSAREISAAELAVILEGHRIWVDSSGETGARVDLSDVNLAGHDLTGENLQGAILTKANLRGADLSLANLQGASLVEADLREANLLGAELWGANLMGANLEGAKGLWIGWLGGTNLFGTTLPESVSIFATPEAVTQATKNARWFYFTMLLANLLAWLAIGKTTDLALLKNGPLLPFARLGDALPTVGFYLVGPLVLFSLYLCFHLLLLRLWGGIAALPAVYPDGQTSERGGPWYLMGLARGQSQWLRGGRSALSLLETAVAVTLAYWAIPLTLVLFWARYLTRQDLRGSLLHVFLVFAGIAVAIALPGVVTRVLRPGNALRRRSKKLLRGVALGSAIAVACGLALASVGILWGAPQDRGRAPELKTADIRRWASEVFWFFGYDPYADLAESEISTRPAKASGGDENLAQVRGARLNHLSLRYAQAYRSYLVNARLWGSDLEGAYLSEADLRGANLREARLRSALLDRALAIRAVFLRADARKANFTGADLSGADLSYAQLEDATLALAKLNHATLYAANLRQAQLPRAELEQADLRDADLYNAVLALANLHQADLWSAKLSGARLTDATLNGAILLEADLRGADLRGANLGGTIFRGAQLEGADLNGADLDMTDLRGALGLTANQVCSAVNWQTARLDQKIEPEVVSRCGVTRPSQAQIPPARR